MLRHLVKLTFAICLSLFFMNCNPPIRTTVSWLNQEKKIPQPNNKIFIVVMTNNLEMKSTLENDLYNAAVKLGKTAYTSTTTFGALVGIENLPIKDAVLKKVRELGCETILTVAMVDQKSETRYHQSSEMSYSPYSMYGGYYGTFSSYYAYSSTSYYSPGYYTTDNTYFIECNLYDANSEAILLSIQSKADNPPGIKKSSKIYTENLLFEIETLKKRYKQN